MKNSVISILMITILLTGKPAFTQFEIQEAFPALTFIKPVDLQHPGDGTNRLFVVEQRGAIQVFENDSNTTSKTVFLDIQSRVDDSGTEEGLLGLAFHPDYENNGYFYVNYTSNNPNRTRISRFKVSDFNPNVAEPDSELILMEIDRPFSNHNAGQLVFGPNDGYLYFTTGDGGSGGDPQGNGQNLQTLLGALLRIDVDNTSAGNHYAIPPTNPFAGNTQGYREEIYAYGLRNTWRFSFDPVTGWLWAGDVGQGDYEEIDIIESGENYGWNIMEGFHCYNPPTGCDTTGLKLPIWEYSHSLGNSVTGGYVYRGPTVPELQGKYIYADYGSGRIWSLEYDGINDPVNMQLAQASFLISTFGVDQNSELYFCAWSFSGSPTKIYRFKPTLVDLEGGTPATPPQDFQLGQNYPNPFNPTTNIPFRIFRKAKVKISIFDLNGKLVKTVLDSSLPAGSHTAIWNGTNAAGKAQASGIYFYRLKVDESAADTMQMLLLR